eukprot:CAMPEP_0194689932 /NCGR_PEP_ID=MMETSP0295-20121207/17971_1 /TAXON_ID=39354 /ORGANISM="Heterosigma akashiwo, Strain CCMP2393" /LENGTH=219 /DNA_ID=CAMNT_0039579199 /DNA_START=153 /DNA_END=813 /DNA_ORIENTATION=+
MLGTKGQPYYQDDNDGEAVMYDQSVPLVPIMPQTPQYKPTHLGPPLPDPSTTGVFSRIFGGFKRVRASSENVRNAEVAQSSAAPRRSSHQSQSTYTDVGPIKTEAPFYPATGLGAIKDGRMHTALTQGDCNKRQGPDPAAAAGGPAGGAAGAGTRRGPGGGAAPAGGHLPPPGNNGTEESKDSGYDEKTGHGAKGYDVAEYSTEQYVYEPSEYTSVYEK